ncbi:hypothetical protein GCM10011505_25070 [Tistrella bauzanensis]|uniref:Uncharacterized protein n=1 Tax=Tistrella bauzanensis TaxID=657419 RepID=A0ABQ1II26_9PROT|nr:hypothetical protein GCM10011505_25070 [Tistrella bauzanensis]
MVGAAECRHVDIGARHIQHRRIAGFPQRQRLAAVGDHLARNGDDRPAGGGRDGDRMVGTGLKNGTIGYDGTTSG